jgi:2-keto-4-pentenoate hydratase
MVEERKRSFQLAALNDETIRRAADELYRAERERKTFPPLTERYPEMDTDDAYCIQLALVELKKSAGARVVGKKIGLTNLRLIGMVLEKNAEVIHTGAGAAVLGHPANAVAWLANAVEKFGVSLKAGEVIMPGALTAASDVARGDLFRASFDGVGSVSVRFV